MTNGNLNNCWSTFGRGTAVWTQQVMPFEVEEEYLKKVHLIDRLLDTINPDTQKWAYHFWTAVLRSLRRSKKDTT
tara:strand:+ start:1488 stop:1712 length:225 start_codon:yes stop_codon:yes gene_type:complete